MSVQLSRPGQITSPRLIRNAIKCGACGDVIESRSQHDHVQCACGQSYVDGGLAYARCGYGDAGAIDFCEYAQRLADVPSAG